MPIYIPTPYIEYVEYGYARQRRSPNNKNQSPSNMCITRHVETETTTKQMKSRDRSKGFALFPNMGFCRVSPRSSLINKAEPAKETPTSRSKGSPLSSCQPQQELHVIHGSDHLMDCCVMVLVRTNFSTVIDVRGPELI